MNNLTLKHLRYCEALARTRHFGRAAADRAVTQPALSMQIRELEDRLGTPLFERGARQVRLTSFGEEFIPRVRAILYAVDELPDLARAASNPLVGRLRIGIIPTVAPYLLPTLVQTLTSRFPGIDLHLRETVTPVLLRELATGALDAAIMALPVSEPSLTEVPLFSERFVLVRQASDRDKPVPDGAELRTMRLLLLEEGHCFRNQALTFCGLNRPRPHELLDAGSLATLVQMVGAGLGVTLIPEMAIDLETRAAPVAVSRFSPPEPQRTIGMVWRRSTPLTGQLDQIADVVSLAELARQSGGPKQSAP